MDPTNDFDDDRLLARWLSGNLTAEEEAKLRVREDFADYARLAEGARHLRPPAYDTEGELARLKKRLGTTPSTAPKQLPRRPRRYVRWAAAASVLLLLGALLWWVNAAEPPSPLQVTTIAGETRVLLLADGSEVRLNAGSQLRYRPEGGTRRVDLSGEAFFEVAEDASQPFIVETPGGTVRVVGTSFNVYSRDDQLRVACTSGKVLVTGSSGESATLTRDQVIGFGTEGTAAVATLDNSDLDWLDGRTVLQSRPLAEAIAELERQYAVTVVVEAELNLQERLTTTFVHDDLPAALRAVFGPLPDVSYRQEGSRIVLRTN